MANPAYGYGAFAKGQPASGCASTKAAARVDRETSKQQIRDKEASNKSLVRKRDGSVCRFPRCKCHALRLHPEVAHCDGEKGIGGDHGTKSHHSQMICLCRLRHQESLISLHYKNLRIVFLTPAKANGPVAWLVNVTALDFPLSNRPANWVEVAREREPRILESLTHAQGALLERIAELSA